MILERIVAVKRQEVALLKEHFDLAKAESTIANLPPARGFENSLRSSKDTVALIAEVKKASPSKGVIREDFDPVRIASEYQAAGASAISVLTDEHFFQGHNQYLSRIRQSVQLPLLRKDFIIDERQIYEARLIGADAILLIAGILNLEELRKFRHLAQDLGLDALVEVHDRDELVKALESDARFIGVNNRDLRTFEVDLKTTEALAAELPDDCLLVSESGIFTHEDVQAVKKAGAKAILVGESLMRQPDIPLAIDRLLGRKVEA
ncbi:indole-3-glycerol phosphate synthase TrpC [Effusibacillus lacus]|uniref:Indole-3-glycerol phosphate synthase n=1 Tax=Effusibacillus lacus TaxID=1348429 RepID=A0A292YLF4_9BACL|nr:indole-3-glycerol phosphate synthase TrpC [Effusibacillus lacus]TCS75305.1 indole-3-glycerol phosphate synthase [Effusibacillus lacus]GAX89741.1 indole-3-glycerol-phosphate synthase [Effusibacillus lacus]